MRWTSRSVRPKTLTNLTEVFRQLRKAPAGTVVLSSKAKRLFARWWDENACLQDEVSGVVRGYFAKLNNQAARLALVLHCLAHPENPCARHLTAKTMADALELTEYFRAHALRALVHFGAEANVSNPLSMRVLRLLQEANGRWLPTGALHTGLGGHVSSSSLEAALNDLAQAGLAKKRCLTPGPRGGRPRTEWKHISEKTEKTEETPVLLPVDAKTLTEHQQSETQLSPHPCSWRRVPCTASLAVQAAPINREPVVSHSSSGAAVPTQRSGARWAAKSAQTAHFCLDESHAPHDYDGADGRRICGVCYPPGP